MTDKRIILSTAGSEEEARKIAHALVERCLAACVNIVGPIQSLYRWKGTVENAAEYMLIIKTTAGAFPRVRDAIQELHSYELPECVMVAIEAGSSGYLDWIDGSVDREIG